MKSNVINLFAERCRDHPDRTAFVSPKGNRLSFAELWQRVDNLSRGLTHLGLRAGDRVVVMIPMSIELYVVLLGIFKMGAIAVFVDPWLKLPTISSFAAFSEPKAFIGIPKSHLLRLLNWRLYSIEIAVSTKSYFGFPTRYTLESLQHSKESGESFSAVNDSSALITFTSGSSGTPKGANRTHGFLLEQHNALRTVIPYNDTDVDFSMFPVFALNNLASGVTTVIPDMDFRHVAHVDAKRIYAQISDNKVTTCTASPPLIDRFVDYLRGTGKTVPLLRRIATGGAPIPNSMLRRWREVLPHTEVIIAYGSTEAEPVAHLTLEERLALPESGKGYCMGHLVPQIRARLIRIEKGSVSLTNGDWSALEVASGEIGELVVSGNHVCREYYRNQSATLENKLHESDGSVWHRMGDTGYFDSVGRFWLTGRVHSTVYRNGIQIHPQLVEQIVAKLLTHDSLKIAALGIPSSQGGEELAIVTNDSLNKKDVKVALAEHDITADHIITDFPSIPVDPRHNSKVDYGKLREMLKGRI